MDLSVGFQTDVPCALIPWTISQAGLRTLFNGHLREVTHGYFTMACVSLGSMRHQLGFHFEPRRSDHLRELEFFRSAPLPLADSYTDFQSHFEAAFGRVTHTRPGTDGFPINEWILDKVRIVHLVQDRFGPEEHMRVQRLGP